MDSLLAVNNLPIIPRPDTLANSTWIMWTIVAIILSLLFTFTAKFNAYSETLKNLLKTKDRTMNYSNAQSAAWIDSLLFFTVLSCYTIFIYTQIRCFANTIPLWSIAAIICGIYIFYILKKVITNALGYAFCFEKKTSLYFNSYKTLLTLLSITLLPLTIGSIYTFDTSPKICLIIASILTVIMLIFVIIKLIQYFYQGYSSLLYIFLYLCILEIIPLLLIINIIPKLLFLCYP